ncbi:hypothetical protein PMX22_20745 [Clostridium butyricum]|mgnify:CR=1 FL=1|jgi:hypothetical protein|uniref:hypothetical protein n=1 Tax=Clostridium butyricum TaxID=1492 RepID=UPI002061587B|nr:hypothetical protein [Clostridium butyricum]MDB2162212.1 hypothetical protein [Clostridium butyricum]DAQ97591.1 MAG TPA: hypothetical protein [Caudoviricetes sp.]
MNINEFIEKIVQYEKEYEIIITTNESTYFITYNDENYKCNDLGNITYMDLDMLAFDLFKKIANRNEIIIEILNE